MPSYKTTGIIIRRHNYAEADRIYTIISQDHGAVEAIAKGVRKAKSKLGAHLELFSEIELMLVEGRNLDILTSARQQRSFRQITADYERLKRGFLFCEMLYKLGLHTASTATYDLLKESLEALDAGNPPEFVELYFKLRLLDGLGYRPNLEQNIKSRQEIEAHKSYAFNSASGSLEESATFSLENPAISAEHIKLWRLLLKYPLGQSLKVKGTQKPASESLPIANDFYDYLFGKRFRSSEI